MPQKGYKLTKIEKKNIKITKQNFEDIKTYGTKNTFEKAFVGIIIDSWLRRRAIQLMKFEDINWDENRFTKKEKYTRPKKIKGENEKEYEKRVEKKILKDINEGEIIKEKWEGKMIYLRIYNGYFSNQTKSHLLDLQLEYNKGFIFRKNKLKNKPIDLSTINRLWTRIIERTNKRLTELNFQKNRQIINTGDKNKKIRIHDVRIAQAKNYLEENKGDYQTAQEMLGHKNIQTTLNIYAEQSPQVTNDKIKKFYNK